MVMQNMYPEDGDAENHGSVLRERVAGWTTSTSSTKSSKSSSATASRIVAGGQHAAATQLEMNPGMEKNPFAGGSVAGSETTAAVNDEVFYNFVRNNASSAEYLKTSRIHVPGDTPSAAASQTSGRRTWPFAGVSSAESGKTHSSPNQSSSGRPTPHASISGDQASATGSDFAKSSVPPAIARQTLTPPSEGHCPGPAATSRSPKLSASSSSSILGNLEWPDVLFGRLVVWSISKIGGEKLAKKLFGDEAVSSEKSADSHVLSTRDNCRAADDCQSGSDCQSSPSGDRMSGSAPTSSIPESSSNSHYDGDGTNVLDADSDASSSESDSSSEGWSSYGLLHTLGRLWSSAQTLFSSGYAAIVFPWNCLSFTLGSIFSQVFGSLLNVFINLLLIFLSPFLILFFCLKKFFLLFSFLLEKGFAVSWSVSSVCGTGVLSALRFSVSWVVGLASLPQRVQFWLNVCSWVLLSIALGLILVVVLFSHVFLCIYFWVSVQWDPDQFAYEAQHFSAYRRLALVAPSTFHWETVKVFSNWIDTTGCMTQSRLDQLADSLSEAFAEDSISPEGDGSSVAADASADSRRFSQQAFSHDSDSQEYSAEERGGQYVNKWGAAVNKHVKQLAKSDLLMSGGLFSSLSVFSDDPYIWAGDAGHYDLLNEYESAERTQMMLEDGRNDGSVSSSVASDSEQRVKKASRDPTPSISAVPGAAIVQDVSDFINSSASRVWTTVYSIFTIVSSTAWRFSFGFIGNLISSCLSFLWQGVFEPMTRSLGFFSSSSTALRWGVRNGGIQYAGQPWWDLSGQDSWSGSNLGGESSSVSSSGGDYSSSGIGIIHGDGDTPKQRLLRLLGAGLKSQQPVDSEISSGENRVNSMSRHNILTPPSGFPSSESFSSSGITGSSVEFVSSGGSASSPDNQNLGSELQLWTPPREWNVQEEQELLDGSTDAPLLGDTSVNSVGLEIFKALLEMRFTDMEDCVRMRMEQENEDAVREQQEALEKQEEGLKQMRGALREQRKILEELRKERIAEREAEMAEREAERQEHRIGRLHRLEKERYLLQQMKIQQKREARQERMQERTAEEAEKWRQFEERRMEFEAHKMAHEAEQREHEAKKMQKELRSGAKKNGEESAKKEGRSADSSSKTQGEIADSKIVRVRDLQKTIVDARGQAVRALEEVEKRRERALHILDLSEKTDIAGTDQELETEKVLYPEPVRQALAIERILESSGETTKKKSCEKESKSSWSSDSSDSSSSESSCSSGGESSDSGAETTKKTTSVLSPDAAKRIGVSTATIDTSSSAYISPGEAGFETEEGMEFEWSLWLKDLQDAAQHEARRLEKREEEKIFVQLHAHNELRATGPGGRLLSESGSCGGEVCIPNPKAMKLGEEEIERRESDELERQKTTRAQLGEAVLTSPNFVDRVLKLYAASGARMKENDNDSGRSSSKVKSYQRRRAELEEHFKKADKMVRDSKQISDTLIQKNLLNDPEEAEENRAWFGRTKDKLQALLARMKTVSESILAEEQMAEATEARKESILEAIIDNLAKNLRNDEINSKKAIFLTQKAMGKAKSSYDFDSDVMQKRYKFHWLNLVKSRQDSRAENRLTLLDSAKARRFLEYYYSDDPNDPNNGSSSDSSSSKSDSKSSSSSSSSSSDSDLGGLPANKKRVKIWGHSTNKSQSARSALLSAISSLYERVGSLMFSGDKSGEEEGVDPLSTEARYFDREKEGDLLVSVYNFKYPNTPDVKSPYEIRAAHLREAFWRQYWREHFGGNNVGSGVQGMREPMTMSMSRGEIQTPAATVPATGSSLKLVTLASLDLEVARIFDDLENQNGESSLEEYLKCTTQGKSDGPTSMSNSRILHEVDGDVSVCQYRHDKSAPSKSKSPLPLQKRGPPLATQPSGLNIMGSLRTREEVGKLGKSRFARSWFNKWLTEVPSREVLSGSLLDAISSMIGLDFGSDDEEKRSNGGVSSFYAAGDDVDDRKMANEMFRGYWNLTHSMAKSTGKWQSSDDDKNNLSSSSAEEELLLEDSFRRELGGLSGASGQKDVWGLRRLLYTEPVSKREDSKASQHSQKRNEPTSGGNTKPASVQAVRSRFCYFEDSVGDPRSLPGEKASGLPSGSSNNANNGLLLCSSPQDYWTEVGLNGSGPPAANGNNFWGRKFLGRRSSKKAHGHDPRVYVAGSDGFPDIPRDCPATSGARLREVIERESADVMGEAPRKNFGRIREIRTQMELLVDRHNLNNTSVGSTNSTSSSNSSSLKPTAATNSNANVNNTAGSNKDDAAIRETRRRNRKLLGRRTCVVRNVNKFALVERGLQRQRKVRCGPVLRGENSFEERTPPTQRVRLSTDTRSLNGVDGIVNDANLHDDDDLWRLQRRWRHHLARVSASKKPIGSTLQDFLRERQKEQNRNYGPDYRPLGAHDLEDIAEGVYSQTEGEVSEASESASEILAQAPPNDYANNHDGIVELVRGRNALDAKKNLLTAMAARVLDRQDVDEKRLFTRLARYARRNGMMLSDYLQARNDAVASEEAMQDSLESDEEETKKRNSVSADLFLSRGASGSRKEGVAGYYRYFAAESSKGTPQSDFLGELMAGSSSSDESFEFDGHSNLKSLVDNTKSLNLADARRSEVAVAGQDVGDELEVEKEILEDFVWMAKKTGGLHNVLPFWTVLGRYVSSGRNVRRAALLPTIPTVPGLPASLQAFYMKGPQTQLSIADKSSQNSQNTGQLLLRQQLIRSLRAKLHSQLPGRMRRKFFDETENKASQNGESSSQQLFSPFGIGSSSSKLDLLDRYTSIRNVFRWTKPVSEGMVGESAGSDVDQVDDLLAQLDELEASLVEQEECETKRRRGADTSNTNSNAFATALGLDSSVVASCGNDKTIGQKNKKKRILKKEKTTTKSTVNTQNRSFSRSKQSRLSLVDELLVDEGLQGISRDRKEEMTRLAMSGDAKTDCEEFEEQLQVSQWMEHWTLLRRNQRKIALGRRKVKLARQKIWVEGLNTEERKESPNPNRSGRTSESVPSFNSDSKSGDTDSQHAIEQDSYHHHVNNVGDRGPLSLPTQPSEKDTAFPLLHHLHDKLSGLEYAKEAFAEHFGYYPQFPRDSRFFPQHLYRSGLGGQSETYSSQEEGSLVSVSEGGGSSFSESGNFPTAEKISARTFAGDVLALNRGILNLADEKATLKDHVRFRGLGMRLGIDLKKLQNEWNQVQHDWFDLEEDIKSVTQDIFLKGMGSSNHGKKERRQSEKSNINSDSNADDITESSSDDGSWDRRRFATHETPQSGTTGATQPAKKVSITSRRSPKDSRPLDETKGPGVRQGPTTAWIEKEEAMMRRLTTLEDQLQQGEAELSEQRKSLRLQRQQKGIQQTAAATDSVLLDNVLSAGIAEAEVTISNEELFRAENNKFFRVQSSPLNRGYSSEFIHYDDNSHLNQYTSHAALNGRPLDVGPEWSTTTTNPLLFLKRPIGCSRETRLARPEEHLQSLIKTLRFLVVPNKITLKKQEYLSGLTSSEILSEVTSGELAGSQSANNKYSSEFYTPDWAKNLQADIYSSSDYKRPELEHEFTAVSSTDRESLDSFLSSVEENSTDRESLDSFLSSVEEENDSGEEESKNSDRSASSEDTSSYSSSSDNSKTASSDEDHSSSDVVTSRGSGSSYDSESDRDSSENQSENQREEAEVEVESVDRVENSVEVQVGPSGNEVTNSVNEQEVMNNTMNLLETVAAETVREIADKETLDEKDVTNSSIEEDPPSIEIPEVSPTAAADNNNVNNTNMTANETTSTPPEANGNDDVTGTADTTSVKNEEESNPSAGKSSESSEPSDQREEKASSSAANTTTTASTSTKSSSTTHTESAEPAATTGSAVVNTTSGAASYEDDSDSDIQQHAYFKVSGAPKRVPPITKEASISSESYQEQTNVTGSSSTTTIRTSVSVTRVSVSSVTTSSSKKDATSSKKDDGKTTASRNGTTAASRNGTTQNNGGSSDAVGKSDMQNSSEESVCGSNRTHDASHDVDVESVYYFRRDPDSSNNTSSSHSWSSTRGQLFKVKVVKRSKLWLRKWESQSDTPVLTRIQLARDQLLRNDFRSRDVPLSCASDKNHDEKRTTSTEESSKSQDESLYGRSVKLVRVDINRELTSTARESLNAIQRMAVRQLVGFRLQSDGEFRAAYELGPNADGSDPQGKAIFKYATATTNGTSSASNTNASNSSAGNDNPPAANASGLPPVEDITGMSASALGLRELVDEEAEEELISGNLPRIDQQVKLRTSSTDGTTVIGASGGTEDVDAGGLQISVGDDADSSVSRSSSGSGGGTSFSVEMSLGGGASAISTNGSTISINAGGPGSSGTTTIKTNGGVTLTVSDGGKEDAASSVTTRSSSTNGGPGGTSSKTTTTTSIRVNVGGGNNSSKDIDNTAEMSLLDANRRYYSAEKKNSSDDQNSTTSFSESSAEEKTQSSDDLLAEKAKNAALMDFIAEKAKTQKSVSANSQKTGPAEAAAEGGSSAAAEGSSTPASVADDGKTDGKKTGKENKSQKTKKGGDKKAKKKKDSSGSKGKNASSSSGKGKNNTVKVQTGKNNTVKVQTVTVSTTVRPKTGVTTSTSSTTTAGKDKKSVNAILIVPSSKDDKKDASAKESSKSSPTPPQEDTKSQTKPAEKGGWMSSVSSLLR